MNSRLYSKKFCMAENLSLSPILLGIPSAEAVPSLEGSLNLHPKGFVQSFAIIAKAIRLRALLDWKTNPSFHLIKTSQDKV